MAIWRSVYRDMFKKQSPISGLMGFFWFVHPYLGWGMPIMQLLKAYPRKHGSAVLALCSNIDIQYEEML